MEDIIEPGTSLDREELIENLFLTFRQSGSTTSRERFVKIIMNETSDIPIKDFQEAIEFLKSQNDFPQNITRAIKRQFYFSKAENIEDKEFSCGNCTDGFVEYYFPKIPLYRWLVACYCPGGKQIFDKWKASIDPENSISPWIREKEAQGHQAEKTAIYKKGFEKF